MKIVEALRGLGVGVEAVDMLDEGGRYTGFGERGWAVDGVAVALCVPEWWAEIEAGGLVGYTMFESTRLPEERVGLINRCAAVCVVPSTFCAESFREAGVVVPIRVVRWGVDVGDYPLLEREHGGRPYTFLWSGSPGFRKGWDLVYRAFWAAFGGSAEARLVMHFRSMPRGVAGFRDGNVEVVEGLVERCELVRMMGEADCFVFPSRGEGWGLPPREAAATGLPVIATGWGGLADEIEHWGLALRVKGLAPAAFGKWERGEVGMWAEPDFDDLVELMRWCFAEREFVARFGRGAARWLGKWGTWERTAMGLMKVMEEVVA
jgi:glycosyltransferase involved in cell wall biosynthesis